MSAKAVRLSPIGAGMLFALCALLVLAHPEVSRSGLPTASVTVCQVSGSASAPSLVQVSVAIDQVAAYLNQHPGSFVGSCPASDGDTGGTSTPTLSGAVTVCRVSGSASAPILSEVVVAADQVAAYVNQNPGSFLGSCPAAAGGNANGPTGSAGPVSAVVTVCRVTGSADAPGLAQLTLAVDEVAAFVNQNPGSFIGTCPGKGGKVTSGPGRILGIPAGAALTICQVTAKARALHYVQANVAIDKVAAFLNQHPGSFVGLCPSASDPGGTLGEPPLGYVTVCRVTGAAGSPLAAATVRVDQLRAYLTRAGTVLDPAASGCQQAPDDPGAEPPSEAPVGKTTEVVVHTTPNTVVTATGAGVNESARSNKQGVAKVKVKPKRQGIVTVRGTAGRVAATLGAASPRRSGGNLTG